MGLHRASLDGCLVCIELPDGFAEQRPANFEGRSFEGTGVAQHDMERRLDVRSGMGKVVGFWQLDCRHISRLGLRTSVRDIIGQ